MDLYTIDEAARITKMSQSWWRQKIFRKEIKFLKLGRSIRIPHSSVEQVLQEAMREPKEE